ncbi:hypothetical protein V8C86DRAFT_192405 [Haematococcus lacustris]
MNFASRLALAVALVLGIALSIRAQTVNSPSQCLSTFNSIGQNNFLIQLLPCQAQPPTQACCDRLQSIAGFRPGASLAGCLCNAELVSTLNQQLASNSLARSAGVTADVIEKTLQTCKVPYVGSGLCPSGGGAPASPATSPAVASPSSPAPSSPASSSPASSPAAAPKPAAPAPGPASSGSEGFLPTLPIGRGGLIQAALRQTHGR